MVALKVLPSAIAADSRATTRFLREAQTAGKLNHPAVVGDRQVAVAAGAREVLDPTKVEQGMSDGLDAPDPGG